MPSCVGMNITTLTMPSITAIAQFPVVTDAKMIANMTSATMTSGME